MEARFLVDAYYQQQEDRIRSAHRSRQMGESGEPNLIFDWLGSQSAVLEQQVKGALDKYTQSRPIGEWLRGIKGIGPVIAAGFIANVDIQVANTAGKLWAYCGVAPGKDRRKRGEKMTFNPSLKRLTFLTGECFKRLSSDDADAYYRHVYDKRKAYELRKNEAGDYSDLAERSLAEKKFGKETEAYKMYAQGKLPLARIDLRSSRYAAKLFLSHMHEVWYEMEFGAKPPQCFAVSVLGHGDYIPPPNWPMQ